VLPVLVALVVVALLAAGGWWLTRDTAHHASAGGSPGTGATRHGPGASPSHRPSPKPSGHASASTSASASASSSPTGEDPSTSATSSPSESTSPSTETPSGGHAGSPADLVADYYGLLPEDTDAAWALLTPALQRRIGEGTFIGFWATIDDVRVDDTEEVGDDVVRVTLTYTTSGRHEQETRELVVEPAGDGYLISEDRGAV
jgi:hypothetical protein